MFAECTILWWELTVTAVNLGELCIYPLSYQLALRFRTPASNGPKHFRIPIPVIRKNSSCLPLFVKCILSYCILWTFLFLN
jgi:hypothetical protein